MKNATVILNRLKKEYPEVGCTLDSLSPLELLVATILSAQCTDKRVNQVTPALFRKYRSAEDYARASLDELEKDIHSTGFYHNKAKNIKEMCRILVDRYGGEVPRTMEELTALPGIGRKTANVVLGNAFGMVTGFVVDTHVFRLAHRLGLSQGTTPVQVEQDLMGQFPKKEWIDTSHRLILLGRGPCDARRPDCESCFLRDRCPTCLQTLSEGVAGKRVTSRTRNQVDESVPRRKA